MGNIQINLKVYYDEGMQGPVYTNRNMKQITWNDFESVELRVGTILEVHDFPEARIPAYKITAGFGEGVGIKKSSAQITNLYTKDCLLGKKIVGVVNFPPKQIGPFMSEFLVTGFANKDDDIVLAVPDKDCSNGSRLH